MMHLCLEKHEYRLNLVVFFLCILGHKCNTRMETGLGHVDLHLGCYLVLQFAPPFEKYTLHGAKWRSKALLISINKLSVLFISKAYPKP